MQHGLNLMRHGTGSQCNSCKLAVTWQLVLSSNTKVPWHSALFVMVQSSTATTVVYPWHDQCKDKTDRHLSPTRWRIWRRRCRWQWQFAATVTTCHRLLKIRIDGSHSRVHELGSIDILSILYYNFVNWSVYNYILNTSCHIIREQMLKIWSLYDFYFRCNLI